MAETLLIVVVLLTSFVVLIVVDVHGKARAFRHGEADQPPRRPPEAVTGVELPPPHFNERDMHQRRRKSE